MFTLLAQVDLSTSFAPAKKFSSLGQMVSLISQLAGLLGGIFVTIAFLYAAYMYLTSHGESKNIEQAKQALTWGVIGLVVILLAFWVVQILQKFTGFNSGIF